MTSQNTNSLALLTEKQPGLLSIVIRSLMELGFVPESQRISDADQQGLSVLSLSFAEALRLSPEDIDAIRRIHPAIRGIRVGASHAAELVNQRFGVGAPIPEPAFFAFLTEYYPDIVDLVVEYQMRTVTERRARSVFALGLNFGRREYRNKYSRGVPLDLEKTLTRMLKPALGKMVKSEVGEHSITIPDCPFCRSYSSQRKDAGCDFIRGFIEGFLRENPKTAAYRLHQTHGEDALDRFCRFQAI